MRLTCILIFGVIFAATSVLPVGAAEFGTRNEAIAMVRRVQEKFRKDGPDATFKAINNKEFVDRDLYPWAFRLDDGTNMANAQTPSVRGKRLIELKDQDGKFVTQEWIRIATTPPCHGWSDYRWPNPITSVIEEKSSYVERMGNNYLVGVGIYGNEQPN
jgi:cytochrome c